MRDHERVEPLLAVDDVVETEFVGERIGVAGSPTPARRGCGRGSRATPLCTWRGARARRCSCRRARRVAARRHDDDDRRPTRAGAAPTRGARAGPLPSPTAAGCRPCRRSGGWLGPALRARSSRRLKRSIWPIREWTADRLGHDGYNRSTSGAPEREGGRGLFGRGSLDLQRSDRPQPAPGEVVTGPRRLQGRRPTVGSTSARRSQRRASPGRRRAPCGRPIVVNPE